MKKVLVTAIIIVMPSIAYTMDDKFYDIPPASPFLYDRVQIFEDPQPGDGWYARALVRNVRGLYNDVEREHTTEGDVHIQYRTSQPSAVKDVNSADEACVVQLPEGVVAIPECVQPLEEETETIFLYKHLGF